jgi:hypothetical protein
MLVILERVSRNAGTRNMKELGIRLTVTHMPIRGLVLICVFIPYEIA